MIIFQILGIILLFFLILIFLLGCMIIVKKTFYFVLMFLTVGLISVLSMFIFSISAGAIIFAALLLGIWLFFYKFQESSSLIIANYKMTWIVGDFNFYEKKMNGCFSLPLNFINFMPDRFCRNKKFLNDVDIKECVRIFLKEGKGFSIDVQFKKGEIQAFVV